ncbi:MAG TPA: T9SS type A sorting domain-containing protein [Bacteroidia bacterium]|nr:T9SS type A sorting domain-containing protein [Bacteroidia bacterium]
MKIKSILVFFTAIASFIVFSSYREGAATNGGWQCTGSETDQGNPLGCSSGGCHAKTATPGIAVTLELDSAGVPVTHYVGGFAYTVKITGTNNTTSTLPKFGLQISCIKDTIPQAVPVNEGTWPAPYPANTQYTAPGTYYLASVVEQIAVLSPASGTGATGTIYSETFNWTAPLAGTGTISFWGVLNAVNYNGTNDVGDLWNTKMIIIHESSVDGVFPIQQNAFNMHVSPNPATANANVTYSLKENANVEASIYDMFGRKVGDLFNGEQAAGEHTQSLDLSSLNLKSGLYILVINNGSIVSSQKLIIQ